MQGLHKVGRKGQRGQGHGKDKGILYSSSQCSAILHCKLKAKVKPHAKAIVDPNSKYMVASVKLDANDGWESTITTILLNNNNIGRPVMVMSPVVDSSLETLMTCIGDYEINSYVYETIIEKKKCIHTNIRPKYELVCLYSAFSLMQLMLSLVHTQNINQGRNGPLLHMQSIFIFQQQSHWKISSIWDNS